MIFLWPPPADNTFWQCRSFYDYALVRITGSHYQYRKVGVPYTIVVPNHNGKDISIGVLKDLEKKTGLSLRR